MISAIFLLLVCQLAGEIISRALHIPVPGPVIGLLFALLYFVARGSVSQSVQDTSQGILKHLSLLFIPAGTGVILHIHTLRSEWRPILIALVVSTVLTLLVTVWVFIAVSRLVADSRPLAPEDAARDV